MKRIPPFTPDDDFNVMFLMPIGFSVAIGVILGYVWLLEHTQKLLLNNGMSSSLASAVAAIVIVSGGVFLILGGIISFFRR